MKLSDIVKVINKEIKWCKAHPDKAFSAEYRKGFANGLIQAKYLIAKLNRVANELQDAKELNDLGRDWLITAIERHANEFTTREKRRIEKSLERTT